MIICPKCGNDNPLGRVFCGKCGGKLDFSHTSSQEMASKQKESWIGLHWKKSGYLVVLIILIPVAMALWPNSAPIGKPPSSGGEKKVETALKVAAVAKKGQTVPLVFGEEDLNAYFQVTKAKALGIESLSVSAMQGFFKVRMVKVLFSLPVKGIALKASYEIACVPVAAGNVAVSKASMGYLPLSGGLKSLAVNAIRKTVTSDKDWDPFKNISDVRAENGRLTVTIKP